MSKCAVARPKVSTVTIVKGLPPQQRVHCHGGATVQIAFIEAMEKSLAWARDPEDARSTSIVSVYRATAIKANMLQNIHVAVVVFNHKPIVPCVYLVNTDARITALGNMLVAIPERHLAARTRLLRCAGTVSGVCVCV